MLTTAKLWFAVEFIYKLRGCASTFMILNRFLHAAHTSTRHILDDNCLIEIDFCLELSTHVFNVEMNQTLYGGKYWDFKLEIFVAFDVFILN